MDSAMNFLIAGVTVVSIIAIIVAFSGSKNRSTHTKNQARNEKNSRKNQAHIIKEANRRLAKDPNDPAGLIPVGDIYYNNNLWEKAYPVYETLSKMAVEKVTIDAFLVNKRAGVCAANLGKIPEAIVALSTADRINPHDFECCYYLGKTLLQNKNYEKAIPCLKKSLVAKPEAEGVYLLLGQALYHAHHYKECLACFKKALDEDPGNKEALYDMADAMEQQGHGDKSIKVFMHLRPDPVYGARSCLAAGVYHARINNHEAAIQDFEIGMKHENAPEEMRVEIEYRLAQQYFSINQITKGLLLLKQIRNVNPNYKDVNSLISRYQELSQNSNLQVYLAANNNDFVPLCRKFIAAKFKKSVVKIQDINVGPLFTDILAEVETSKWEETKLFRFFRTSGSTGELYIRDFHGHMQDVKADTGFCVTAGVFSEEAHKYTEGRPVDLIEKAELVKILKELNT